MLPIPNGSGKTVKTIQKSGPDGEITTSFEYDGIQRLVRITDTEGNVTTSTYDMGDRRTEVNHAASGITSFTYDALGNVADQADCQPCKGRQVHYLRLRLSASDGYQLHRPSGEQREVLHNRVNKNK